MEQDHDRLAEKGSIDVNDSIFSAKINPDLMHRAIVMRLANRRNPIAHTLTRGEVNKTTKKAFRQKGTGNARRGALSTSLLRGGGVCHGPRNDRNFTKAMPKKERRAALFSSLSQKAEAKKCNGAGVICRKSTENKSVRNTLEQVARSKKIPLCDRGKKRGDPKVSPKHSKCECGIGKLCKPLGCPSRRQSMLFEGFTFYSGNYFLEMIRTDQVLIEPINTEKTVTTLHGKYVFLVHQDASKTDVKAALKEFYGVDAEKVNMVNSPEKTRIVGQGVVARKRKPQRKAIVTLADGKTIDFNAFK
ncbi:50S ribosomal protein L4 [Candidatus Gracilibacteria bacterium]|nr:50S ribosomal protein L4 [Candidatus Gracilibacteria bacterium]